MKKKKCFKCEATLPLSDFYAHPMMADGHLGKCKECNKRDTVENRAKRVGYYRAYDSKRAVLPHRKKLSREKERRKRLAMGPDYDAAHNAVARAVVSGELVRPEKCSRCKVPCSVNGHHDDYSKPLEVMWLCVLCHAARHKELGRLTGTRKF